MTARDSLRVIFIHLSFADLKVLLFLLKVYVDVFIQYLKCGGICFLKQFFALKLLRTEIEMYPRKSRNYSSGKWTPLSRFVLSCCRRQRVPRFLSKDEILRHSELKASTWVPRWATGNSRISADAIFSKVSRLLRQTTISFISEKSKKRK